MTVRVGDIGKIFIINSGIDLSGNTDLRMVFKKPDGTIITKTALDGVVAPAGDITIDIDGVPTLLLASQYWQYASESGLLDVKGRWEVHGEYVDGTPEDLAGDISAFKVIERI